MDISGSIIITIILSVLILIYGIVSYFVRIRNINNENEKQEIFNETVMSTAFSIFAVIGTMLLIMACEIVGGSK